MTTVLPACCYCGNAHRPVGCDTVVRVSTRKQILKKSGRCFISLRKGHLSRDCKSTGQCRQCKGHHHSNICEHSASGGVDKRPVSSTRQVIQVQLSNNTAQSVPVKSSTSAAQNLVAPATTPQNLSTSATTLNPSAPTFTSTPTSTNLYVGSSKAVLLQTAIAEVYNPKNTSSTLKLRFILDSGSQCSYHTEQVKNTLGLQRVKQQQLSILTFGSSQQDTRYCEVVRIGIVPKVVKIRYSHLWTISTSTHWSLFRVVSPLIIFNVGRHLPESVTLHLGFICSLAQISTGNWWLEKFYKDKQILSLSTPS